MYTICSQHFFFFFLFLFLFFYQAFQSTSKKGVWLYWLFLASGSYVTIFCKKGVWLYWLFFAGSFRSFSLQWLEAFTEISSTADHLTKEVPINDETISCCFSLF
jgi:hypothetical protein